MNYRLKIMQDIDTQVSRRPTYWYSVEQYSQNRKGWTFTKVAFTLLDIVRYMNSLGLHIDTIPLAIVRFYEN